MSIRESLRESFGILRRLRRNREKAWLGGVCAGIADYAGGTVTAVRVIALLILLFTGFWPGVILYCLLWWLIDPAGEETEARRADAASTPRSSSYAPGGAQARFARLEERLRNIEECVTSRDFELRRELKRLET